MPYRGSPPRPLPAPTPWWHARRRLRCWRRRQRVERQRHLRRKAALKKAKSELAAAHRDAKKLRGSTSWSPLLLALGKAFVNSRLAHQLGYTTLDLAVHAARRRGLDIDAFLDEKLDQLAAAEDRGVVPFDDQ